MPSTPPPAIDVLLPFYGDIDLMKASVDSVLSQREAGWRLWISDDCYPDRSMEKWISGLAHPSVTYHRNTEQLGVSGNFQQLLEMARADYVVMMGGDDVMLPNYLQLIRHMTRSVPNADLLQPGVRVIDETGRQVRPLGDRTKQLLTPRAPKALHGERLATSLARGNWLYFPSLTWRRKRLLEVGFDSELEIAQDLGVILQLVGTGSTLAFDPEVAFHYRRHAASESAAQAVRGRAEEAQVLANAAAAFHARGWTSAARAARHRLTSRLHSAALLPSALADRDLASLRALARLTLSA